MTMTLTKHFRCPQLRYKLKEPLVGTFFFRITVSSVLIAVRYSQALSYGRRRHTNLCNDTKLYARFGTFITQPQPNLSRSRHATTILTLVTVQVVGRTTFEHSCRALRGWQGNHTLFYDSLCWVCNRRDDRQERRWWCAVIWCIREGQKRQHMHFSTSQQCAV